MPESRKALAFDASETTQSSAPTVATEYASVEAALAAVAGSTYVNLESIEIGAEIRAILLPTGKDASPDDKTVLEDLYGVLRRSDGVLLAKLGTLTGTLGTVAATGAPTDHKYAKACEFASLGVHDALLGGFGGVKPFPSGGANGSFAGVAIFDRGPFIGILRARYIGTADAAGSGLITWR